MSVQYVCTLSGYVASVTCHGTEMRLLSGDHAKMCQVMLQGAGSCTKKGSALNLLGCGSVLCCF